MLFNEETSDIRADHIDFKIESDIFAVLFGHHEEVAVYFLELLNGVTEVVNGLLWDKGLVLNHEVKELNKGDTDSVLFRNVTNKLNLLIRNGASVSDDVSNNGFEGFSDIVGLLVFEKGNIDLFGKREVESTSLQVLAEVLFEGTDLRHKRDFEFILKFCIKFRGLTLRLFEEQVFQQVRARSHNGQMSHREQCLMVGLSHFSWPSLYFLLKSVQVRVSVHLDTEPELSQGRIVSWKLLHNFSVLGVWVLLGWEQVLVLLRKQGPALLWKLAFWVDPLSVVYWIVLFRVKLLGSLSGIFALVFLHHSLEHWLSDFWRFCLFLLEPSDLFEISQKLLPESHWIWEIEEFFVNCFENVQSLSVFISELPFIGLLQ